MTKREAAKLCPWCRKMGRWYCSVRKVGVKWTGAKTA